MLICQGERDTFGTRAEVAGYALSPSIKLHWLPDGNHDLLPRRGSGVAPDANLISAADAVITFIRALPVRK